MNLSNIGPSGFKLLPDIVRHIIILNVLFFIVQYIVKRQTGNDINFTMGLHYPESPEFRPFQFLTYMFLHGSLMHIFFNLFAIWMFGSVIEQVLGSSRFLIYYLFTGIGAALLHILVDYIEYNPTFNAVDALLMNPTFEGFTAFTNSDLFKFGRLDDLQLINNVDRINLEHRIDPEQAKVMMVDFLSIYQVELARGIPLVVGASGSLFGILLAYGMLFPNTLIYLYFAIPIKAKYFVMIYGGLELFLGVSNNPGDNVAHFAHLGGMVFGFILLKLWGIKKRI